MEIALIAILVIMIIGSLYALHAKDLMSAVVAFGIIGFGLVIAFLLLKAPDLAIVQTVVETISLIIMISVLIISTRKDLKEQTTLKVKGVSYVNIRAAIYITISFILIGFLLFYFSHAIRTLDLFGEHETRMATEYIQSGIENTGSVNLVTGIVFDFRGYDTLGEATILFTAVIGVLTILRLKGRKQ